MRVTQLLARPVRCAPLCKSTCSTKRRACLNAARSSGCSGKPCHQNEMQTSDTQQYISEKANLAEAVSEWLGLPPNSTSSLGLVFVPFATMKFSPWTALLFTAGVTWFLTSGVLSLIRMLSDEASAPLHIVKLQLALTSEAHGLRQEMKELEQYYHSHNSPDLYYLVEECLMEIEKRWGHCLSGTVQVSSTSSYRKAQLMFDEAAMQERTRARNVVPDGPLFGRQDDSSSSGGGGGGFGLGLNKGGGLFGLGGSGKLLGNSVSKRMGRVFAGRSAKEQDEGDAGEVVVATLLLLTTKPLEVQPAGTQGRVNNVLQQLQGLTSGQIMDAQLLWTPLQQGQYISKDTLQRHFSEMQCL